MSLTLEQIADRYPARQKQAGAPSPDAAPETANRCGACGRKLGGTPAKEADGLWYHRWCFKYRRRPARPHATDAAARYVQRHTKQADLQPHVQLREHQEQARDIVADPNVDGQLFMHGLGTGKTLSSIAAVDHLGEQANVVVPAALRNNYKKDLHKFVEAPTIGPEGQYNVDSYDRAAKGALQPRPILVADEVQRLRNQGRGYQGVMNLARQAKKRILLSGTPIVNNPGDLASIVNLLHGKDVLDKDKFESQFLEQKVHKPFLGLFGQARVEPRIKNKKKLMGLLQNRVHYVGDVADTKPQTTTEDVMVPMSKTQDRWRRYFEGQLPRLLRWKLKHNLPPNRRESKQLSGFLSGPRQIHLSPHTFDKNLDAFGAFQQSPKLMKAFDDIQEQLKNNGKVMSYSNFIDAGLVPLSAALERHKIPFSMFHGGMNDVQRRTAIDGYNNGTSRVALIGPAGSEGLSLKGTTLAQILDPHWNEARSDQAQGRAVRLDSHVHLPPELRNVLIRRYLSQPHQGMLKKVLGVKPPSSTDVWMQNLAANKQQRLDVVNDLLREVGTRG